MSRQTKEMQRRIVAANEQVQHVACPNFDCLAPVGEPCKSVAMGVPTFPHVGRTRAAREVVG